MKYLNSNTNKGKTSPNKKAQDDVSRNTSAGIKSFLWKKSDQSQDHTTDQVNSTYSSTWESTGRSDDLVGRNSDTKASCAEDNADFWQVDPSTAEKVLVAFAR